MPGTNTAPRFGKVRRIGSGVRGSSGVATPGGGAPANSELREDGSYELREDGGYELRE